MERGIIAQISGPVVDVEVVEGELPRLQEADLRFCPLEHTEVLEQLACKVTR